MSFIAKLSAILSAWRLGAKKHLAFGAAHGDIAAVRHDLPHMPSLGVSSLDLGRFRVAFFLPVTGPPLNPSRSAKASPLLRHLAPARIKFASGLLTQFRPQRAIGKR
jgi:hypothetical protein